MSKKIKDTDYLYLTATLRAREAKMLTREKMERILDAATYEESAKLLEESGFEDMSKMTSAQVEGALAKRRAEIFDELSKSAPDPKIVDIFRLRYDYHNIKTIIKAEGVGVDGARLLSGAGRIDPAVLLEACREDEFRFIPKRIADAAADAKSVLARTGNPQLADFILDRAQYSEMLSIADEVGSGFLKSYARISIDSVNLRAVVRTARMGRDVDFLRSALIPGGFVDCDRLLGTAVSGGEGLAAIFTATVLERAAAVGAEAMSGSSLTIFELECDNALNSFLGSAKLVSFGEDPVIAHIAAVEGEIMAARMILTGRLADIDPVIIRERLRETYA